MARDPFTGTQIRIGVMGSAATEFESRVAQACRQLGRAIAEQGCCLLTGACPGLPHEAVLGAKEAGGHVIGISPALSLKEHVETFGSPYEQYDVLIYTGLGRTGRELINIRSSDIVVIIGGRCGTLGRVLHCLRGGQIDRSVDRHRGNYRSAIRRRELVRQKNRRGSTLSHRAGAIDCEADGALQVRQL